MRITSITYPTSANGTLRLKTLVLIRWIAIVGQLAALLVAQHFFSLSVNSVIPLCIIAASLLVNLYSHFLLRKHSHLHDHEGALALAFDTLQLTALLYYTGGLGNPFVILILAPLAVSAAALSGRSVILLTLLGLIALTTLYAVEAPPLWPQVLPPLFYLGEYVAMMFTSLFMVLYVRRVARESRRLGDALTRSLLQLEREQKISAFGALAAAFAHELGSPLGTIAVIARELSHSVEHETQRNDINLLESEVQRCKKILADLARSHTLHDDTGLRLKLSAYLEKAAQPYKRKDITVTVENHLTHMEPEWLWHPVLAHGIGNIIQNACQFAKSAVRIIATEHQGGIMVTVIDDGHGFPKEILSRLGLAYTSGRSKNEKEGHMGLGLFIAKNLLERSGATITFANIAEPAHGASISIFWQSTPSL